MNWQSNWGDKPNLAKEQYPNDFDKVQSNPKPSPFPEWDNKSQDDVLYKRLKQLLHYDPNTGVFVWIYSTNPKIKIFDIAGCLGPQGYIRIRFDGKYYQAHRLAWLYMTGSWPEKEMLDHKDTIRSNNKWNNLREATRQQNSYNRSKTNGILNAKGVTMHYDGKKYRAQICIDGKMTYLGIYKTLNEAKNAYEDVADNIQKDFKYKSDVL